MRMTVLAEMRGSFRYRVVACFAVGLALQAALGPAALASTAPGSGSDRSPPVPNLAPSLGKSPDRTASVPAAGRSAKESPASPGDSVPELWTPRAAMVVDTNEPLGAESLFDGNATTGFTTAADGGATLRLDLGAAREVVGLGVHGTGQAKITIYAEDAAGRRPIDTGHDGAINLAPDHWAQLAPTGSTKTSTLVVQWTASPTAPVTVTELALWVGGRSRQALAEAAIADRLVTELPENAVAATAVPWSASVARITPQGPVSASFTVKVNSEPRLGRAFLVYDLDRKAHWTGVARSINGHVVRGGYRAEAKGLGGVQVEEINPAWLTKGDNKISFEPTRLEDGHGYSVSNVRVVSVPHGVDAAPAPGARSPLSDGDLETGVGGPGVHGASVAMPADREPAFLSFYLDKPTGGTLTAAADGGRGRKGKVQVDLQGRPAGWQTVPVAGVLPASSELRARVQGGRDSTGQVSEARIIGFPALTSHAELAVSYPLHGECNDHKTYVRGFVSGPSRLQKPQLFLDGQPTKGRIDPDGSFEAEVNEPAATKGKPWSVRLEVATEGGGRLVRTVPLDTCIEPPKKRIIGVSPPVEDVGAPYGAVVSAHRSSTLSFAGAKIEIPAGAVESDVRVTMRALDRGQLPPIDAEMDNVTVDGGALRFGPHGLKFKKPVTVTLPVDAARLPPGMTSGDVIGFFFDEARSKWAALPKVSGRADLTVAQTTHFTDFIAGTIRMPEHPEAQQFNPNTMKGVKAGVPHAGITMIAPPTANSSGSASLSYPIETPPGRNGIAPSLALTYDSERVNANGWLGVGWDLRMSSIEIDTRFGVPKYGQGSPVDIYTLDGAMLAETTPAGTYIKRVEGSFDLIKRTGSGPTDYSWTVTDRNGTKYTYGAGANSRLKNVRTTGPLFGSAMAPQQAIFRWYLDRVEDSYGNYMTITYQHDTYTSGAETYDDVYPAFIDYTAGRPPVAGGPPVTANYHVEFRLDDVGTRPDNLITARPGFLVSTRRRLKDIYVRSGTTTGPVVRQYRFRYQTNLSDTMQKSVLESVALLGTVDSDASELYRHTFEYNKAPAAVSGQYPMFDGQRIWGNAQTDDDIVHATDNLGGGALTLGVGFPVWSATGSFGMDSGDSTPDLDFLDITGEGLPSQVNASGAMSLNSILGKPDTASDHFAAATLTNLPGFGNTGRSGWTAGGNLSVMSGFGSGSLSYARHLALDNGIVSDINGDGFPDVVFGGSSSVGAWVNDGKRNFVSQTWTGYNLTNSTFSNTSRLTEAGGSTNQAFFNTSALVRWAAPYTGSVRLNVTAAKESAADTDDIRVELYINNTLINGVDISDADTAVKTLALNLTQPVTAGDRIYVRVKNRNLDTPSNGASVSASILYQSLSTYFGFGRTDTEVDPTGSRIFNYNLTNDFKVYGLPRIPWHLTANGDVGVARCFFKSPTADNVKISYVIRDKNNDEVPGRRFDMPSNLTTAAASGRICFPDTPGSSFPPTSDPDMAEIKDVVMDQTLALEVTSDTPIDPDAVTADEPNNTHMMSYTKYCRPRLRITGEECGAPIGLQQGFTIPNDPWGKFPILYQDVVHDEGTVRHYVPTYVWNVLNRGQTTPQPMRSVGRPTGVNNVTFGGTLALSAALTEATVVLIQAVNSAGVGRLLKKVKIPAGTPAGTLPANLQIPAGSVAVATSDRVFFTVYHPTISGGSLNNWAPTMAATGATTVTVSQNDINKAVLDPTFDNNQRLGVTTRDPMSGGFHRWFYGDWNDSKTFADFGRMPNPPTNVDAVMGAIPVASSDAAPWVGRGGAQITSDVFLQPGQVSNPIATATSAAKMQALRVSDTWNLDLSVTVQGITGGVNGGDSITNVDFFDMNGDGLPDSITRDGVQYNSGGLAFGLSGGSFGSRMPSSMWFAAPNGNQDLRRILNVTLQAGFGGNGSRKLINLTKGDGESKQVAASAAINASLDYGVSSTRVDFVDVNGDGLPDRVLKEPAATSSAETGALRVRLNLGYGFSNEVAWAGGGKWDALDNYDHAEMFFPQLPNPGNVPNPVDTLLNKVPGRPNNTHVLRLQDTGTAGFNFGGNLGDLVGGGGGPTWSVTRKWVDFVDVNGDGLADQVLKKPGDAQMLVKLNKGDSFDATRSWNMPDWDPDVDLTDFQFMPPDGLEYSTSFGWSANFSVQYCYFLCAGMSGFLSRSNGGTSAKFEDINGDGVVDQVMKVPGDSKLFWKKNRLVNTDPAAGKLGPPNLLTAVNRPLGGRIDISYARSGNHVDLAATTKVNMPSNKWAMSSVVVQSGVAQSWNASTTQNFVYSDFSGHGTGYYDPDEREDLGYQQVRTRFPGEDVTTTSVLQTYLNQNYYLRGLEQSASSYQDEANGVILQRTFNVYNDPSGKNPDIQPKKTGTYFPAPVTTLTSFYEAASQPTTHSVGRTFNTGGDLTDVRDTAEVDFFDTSDDFNYHIDYQTITTPVTMAVARVPSVITVRTGTVAGSGTLLAKRTAAFTTNQPTPTSVTDAIAGGRRPDTFGLRTATSPANATWSFKYDTWGNVDTVASPVNTQATNPQSTNHTLQYTYDTTTRTYPTQTKQIHPSPAPADPANEYVSTAVYDLRFGLPTRIIDVAGARQEIDYDAYGRVTKVWAPTDFDQNGVRGPTPTIDVAYSQAAHTFPAAETVPAWAMATHSSKAPPEGSVPGTVENARAMRTVNFVDGLSRSIQVKQDITRDDGSGTKTDGMSVSGETVFDARGRVYQQGQPAFVAGTGTPTAFMTTFGLTHPTSFAYDVLGRVRQEQHPDVLGTATTTISYQLGVSPKDGRLYRVKLTADPLHDQDPDYHYRTEYLNVRDNLKLVHEPNRINQTLTDLYTQYNYDQLGRLLNVTDANGNVTSAEWDTVGNLVAVTSPDAGRREWLYCEGGQVCGDQSQTQRDVTFNNRTRYVYDHDRLKTITYPNAASNPPVTYVYGTATETGPCAPSTTNCTSGGYRANRVKQRVDEAGTFDYNYDSLGNVATEAALLKNQMVPGTNYPSYTTQYTWDTFGRVIDVTIPGTTTETIRYGYDAGGAVTSAWGRVGTGTSSPYVKHVGYDEFGARTRITYGNDAFSRYSYIETSRRLAEARTTIQGGVAQHLEYSYDLLGNVTGREQNLPWDTNLAHPVPIGGFSSMWFYYDPLNQFTHADFYNRTRVTAAYYAYTEINYDNIGNMTTKSQGDSVDVFDAAGNYLESHAAQGDTSYGFMLTYGGRPHAPISNLEDRNGVASTRSLTYDGNGSLTSSTINGTGRFLTWTEAGRIKSMCNGTASNCAPLASSLYSADGTRTHNKVTQGQSATETLYVNQQLTVRNGTLPTKHVYLGDQRIASKVEGTGPARTYWYHSDNIQSTQYVTTDAQALVQHLEYFPGGEIWRSDEKDASKLTPEIERATTFTGKEFDAASGYYYYGARYYEPQMQMWLSPDPILASYMRGGPNGGVFNPGNLGVYSYAFNNPVNITDPSGLAPDVCAANPCARNSERKAWFRSMHEDAKKAGKAGPSNYPAADCVNGKCSFNWTWVDWTNAKREEKADGFLGGVLNAASDTAVLAAPSVPMGFATEAQFKTASDELIEALRQSGIDDAKVVGVRGSSVTGESERKGTKFNAGSDIDFFVESEKITKGLKESPNIPGFVHPDRIAAKFPALARWAARWTGPRGINRKVSTGGFRPGMLPPGPKIKIK
jgi:RHS repeat-associated protein